MVEWKVEKMAVLTVGLWVAPLVVQRVAPLVVQWVALMVAMMVETKVDRLVAKSAVLKVPLLVDLWVVQ